MDYNTTREKLILPEYGRYVQQMIEQVKQIPDREKRNEQIRAIVSVMAILNPALKDQPDFKHKLWDHVHIIAGLDLDIDSPYPAPTKEELESAPDFVPMVRSRLESAHYGRNIQNMIDVLADMPADEIRDKMLKSMATYMRQQYLIWNKDTVSEETIFNDIEKLSGGKLVVPSHIHLEMLSSKEKFKKPGIMGPDGIQPRKQPQNAQSGSSGTGKKKRHKKKKAKNNLI